MRTSGRRRRLPRGAVILVAVAVAVPVLPLPATAGAPLPAAVAPVAEPDDGSSAALADDLTAARARAARLAVRLERLHARWELAQERRAEAEAALNGSVGAEMAGARAVDAVTRARADRAAEVERAVRALYMGGGTSALYASVLDGTSLADVAIRASAVSQVLAGRLQGVEDADAALAAAQRAQDTRERRTVDRLGLAAEARAAEDQAAALEARIEAARARADTRLAALVEEEQARLEAERKAAAEAALLAAGQTPWGGAVQAPADELAAVERALQRAQEQPSTPWAAGALADARQWLGTPYSAGGGGPDGPSTGWCSSSAPDDGRTDSGACAASSTVGFDCSSFVQRVYSAGGLTLPRTSREQWWAGRRVPMSQLVPGDLLFWAYDTSSAGSIHHVALYLGDGLMVHSPHTGDRVRVAAVYTNGLIGAVRPGTS
jgi:peptidoglycan DL-endopeptidase RipA